MKTNNKEKGRQKCDMPFQLRDSLISLADLLHGQIGWLIIFPIANNLIYIVKVPNLKDLNNFVRYWKHACSIGLWLKSVRNTHSIQFIYMHTLKELTGQLPKWNVYIVSQLVIIRRAIYEKHIKSGCLSI